MTPRSSRIRVLGGALLALGLLAPAATTAVAAPPSTGTRGSEPAIEPVIDSNFPDPDILMVDGTYHAYATNSDGDNVQYATSTDLETWTEHDDVLPVLGDWVGECSFGAGGASDHCIWAPEVTAVEGGYALYYTARDDQSGRQCIGAAFAADPAGPFLPGSEPLVCPADQGGAIDASTYSEDGDLYLLWKADGNCCSLPSILYLQSLSDDGTTLTGPPTELLRNDPNDSERFVVEAPTLVKLDGTYYLIHSANDFFGGNYRTQYATSSSLSGPYTDQGELMTSEMFGGEVAGPGGQDVVVGPDGDLAIVFHGWDETFTYRAMYFSGLEVEADGDLSVTDAADLYEAEDGVVTGGTVRQDSAASGGAVVGALDYADSSVTIRVEAEKTGRAVLGIRYDNGSTEDTESVEATGSLTVNGHNAGTVTFEHTTWGNWAVVEASVHLRKGTNEITLTKGAHFVEVDAFYLERGRLRTTQAGPPADPTRAARYEAEDGIVTNARVRSDGAASGGAVVGGLDFADSSITWEVCVTKAGPTTLAIRYANGSERGGYGLEAVHSVTVEGRDAGQVVYAHTRWGNWQTVEHEVVLRKGCSTVTLTREAWFAEIDAVDVY